MRCRPGDLAVLISARDVPENLNKILEVVYQDEDGWMCRSRYPMLNTMGVSEPPGAMGWVPDRCLRPLPSKRLHDETHVPDRVTEERQGQPGVHLAPLDSYP